MAYDVKDFQRDVIDTSRSVPVVVDFWAAWCAPCRILGPTLEKLADEAAGAWRLAKLDTETFPDIATRYGVGGIPDVRLFVDGAPVDGFVGALPESQVRAWLDRALPNEGDREARAAVERARALVFREPAEALAILDGVELPADLTTAATDLRHIADLIAKLEDPGPLLETPAGLVYLSGIQRLAEEDFDGALGDFIAALREDRSLDDDGPRRACATIFRILGPDDPTVRGRRGELAGALYV